jgi:peptide/nickel transport system substrate-binding protein
MGRATNVLIASLAILSGVTSAVAQHEDSLRIRLRADIRSLDPGTDRDANTDIVQTHLFEGLVGFDEHADVKPMLAKSVDVSPDGTTYTFTLRDGLTFSNGSELTSDDVLFAWRRYTNPSTGWRCLPEVDGRGAVKVARVEAPDKKTIVFTLEKPSALFLVTLARPDCGQTGIYHKSSLGSDGKWKEPVATGPLKLAEWKRGQYLNLIRNERYSSLPGARDGLVGNKTMLVPKVQFTVVPDDSTTKAAIFAGNLDVNSDVESTDLVDYKSSKGIIIESSPIMGIQDFLIQTKDPLLSDVRIRKAFLLALDMEELVTQVTAGQAKPNNSPIPPSSAFYKAPQAIVSKRDLAEAKRLLEQAGYRGQPIKMTTNKQYQAMFDQAIIAQAMAKEAGINIELEVLEWGAQQERYLSGNYQIMSHSFSPRLDPSLSFEMFTGDKVSQPRKAWDNPQAIELLEQSMQIQDPTKRQALFDKLEQLYRADIPMITLYSSVRTSAANSRVVGYKSWPLGSPRAWGVSLKN